MDSYKILLLLIFAIIFHACKDCEPKPIKIPEKVEFSIYPERREYKIGDTIYFLSSTDETIFPTGFNINSDVIVSQIPAFQYHKYFSDSVFSSNAGKKFDSFLLKGTKYASQAHQLDVNIISFSYVQEDNIFLAKVGIILKDTGVYSFIPGSGGIKTQIGERCEEFEIFFPKYQNDNNNWMFTDSLNNINSTPDSRRNYFSFIVKPK